jgi:hypothetical protein
VSEIFGGQEDVNNDDIKQFSIKVGRRAIKIA